MNEEAPVDAKKTKAPLKEPHDSKLEAIAGFLGLDVLALTAFGFGGYTGLLFLRIIGVFIALLIYPYLRYNLSQGKKETFPILALVSFAFLGFSYFWISYYSYSVLYGILFNLIVVAGYIGFFLLGGGLRRLPGLKKEYIALALFGGLALLVLISGIYSLARYGFFYVSRYGNMVYYFDGVVFKVASEGKFLDGFLFRETTLSFAKAPAFILSCVGVGLFALRPKDGWRFYTLLGFALVGILDLLFTPYWTGLLLLIPVYLVFGIGYLIRHFLPGESNEKKRDKIAKVFFILLLCLAIALVLVLFIDTFMGDSGLLKSIPVLYRNGKWTTIGQFIGGMEEAMSLAMFTVSGGVRSFNFLTFLFGASAVSDYGYLNVADTSVFEFTIFSQNGFIGFAGLLILIFFGIYHGYRYIDKDGDLLCRKMAFVGPLLGIFLYFSFLNEEMPLIHAYRLDEFFSYHSSLLVPLSRSSYFLIAIFLLGYIYTPKSVKLEEKACRTPIKEEKIAEEAAAYE